MALITTLVAMKEFGEREMEIISITLKACLDIDIAYQNTRIKNFACCCFI